ncbi:hypothetical protein H2203_004862 [Taxawa tesnikishii (nom. ined.)]|nr:hypothetical protein H2203_004862 [Dothideales sp. JES 119]
MSTSTAYKLLTAKQWVSWQQSQKFTGASIDIRDGYIHLSTANQTSQTYDKYFKDQPDIVLAAVDLGKVDGEVKWEKSRGGELFPHVYGTLPFTAVMKIWEKVTGGIVEGLNHGNRSIDG